MQGKQSKTNMLIYYYALLVHFKEAFLNEFLVDAPTNITTEVAATSCLIKWSLQKYVREYQITYSETNRNSIKLAKVDGNEDNVSRLLVGYIFSYIFVGFAFGSSTML